MRRTNAVYFLAGLLIAGSASLAAAEPFGGNNNRPADMTHPGMDMMLSGFHHPGMMNHGTHWRHDPARAVIMDMRGIERLDRMSGRSQELVALYNHVLDTTKNPVVRHYAYAKLARSQMKPANVDQAVATLRKSLDEDLARLDAAKKN
ncbi:MAG TPA: hypothetical protein VFM15_03620 [Gammaproteobacteria bacterium]|nr:hypothetical protein [Gammaproteobacteria bacterium]